jgi:HSP20 family protein
MSLLACASPNDRLYRRVSGLNNLLGLVPQQGPVSRFFEDQDNYQVQIDLPGVKKDEVKIQVEGDQLSIEAVRHHKFAGQDQSFNISRAFTIPDDVNHEQISAEQVDGVLSLTLPKKEETKPKTISVSVK